MLHAIHRRCHASCRHCCVETLHPRWCLPCRVAVVGLDEWRHPARVGWGAATDSRDTPLTTGVRSGLRTRASPPSVFLSCCLPTGPLVVSRRAKPTPPSSHRGRRRCRFLSSSPAVAPVYGRLSVLVTAGLCGDGCRPPPSLFVGAVVVRLRRCLSVRLLPAFVAVCRRWLLPAFVVVCRRGCCPPSSLLVGAAVARLCRRSSARLSPAFVVACRRGCRPPLSLLVGAAVARLCRCLSARLSPAFAASRRDGYGP